MKKSIMKIIFVLGLLLLIFSSNVLALVAINQYETVSYGIAMFLMIWQWLQYIIPVLTFIILLVVNRKNLNIKKIILFLLIGAVTFLIYFGIGNFIANNSDYKSYTSATVNMFKYNGKIMYYHK